MLVTWETFNEVLDDLQDERFLILDTETTGLQPWLKDRLFSVIVAALDGSKNYYFNFIDAPEFAENEVLHRDRLATICDVVLKPGNTIGLHNAKFDMAMLYREGVRWRDVKFYCSEVGARLEYNDHMRYRLEDVASRIGFAKDDAVEEYIKKHKLYRKDSTPGSQKKKTLKFYDKVPKSVIVPYGLQDARVTGEVILHQLQTQSPQEAALMENEMRFAQVLFDMEARGVRIDRKYCQEAFAYEHAAYEAAAAKFKEVSGEPLVDSGKSLAKILAKSGVELPLTEKGNFQVSEAVLQKIEHPLVECVLTYREHNKKAHTYYQNLLVLSDTNDIIHTDFKQAGARTGRLSCKEPNMQNVPKEEDDTEDSSPFKVRKAFLPRQGFFFVEIDYKAMEFRMMLDYAGQKDLIAAIQNGLDPHQATADLVGIPRKPAKTLNFGLLYGMGVDKLAASLKVVKKTAQEFKDKYFDALGRVKLFLAGTRNVARSRGYVMNWAGRKYYFPKSEFAYKAANAIIQGGCAEVVKFAMVNLAEFLRPHQTRMVLQVHDSILFEVHDSEAYLVPELAAIMGRAYPHKLLALECDIKWSRTSWGELKDWGTFGQTKGNPLQGSGAKLSESASEHVVREDSAGSHQGDTGLSSVHPGALCGPGAEEKSGGQGVGPSEAQP